jgi:hypothetical protein
MAKRILNFAEARKKHVPRRFYPLQLPFSYIAVRRGRVVERGWGETVEMSSNQIRVAPAALVNAKFTELVLSIAWPVKHSGGAGLQLVAHVLPCLDGSAGLFRILQHEFRTVSREANGFGLHAGLRRWADDLPLAAAGGM